MVLRNLQKVTDKRVVDIRIKDCTIDEIGSFPENLPVRPEIHFDNHIVFTGLINSHDHLDFNLFPQLGNRLYNNYVEWGLDIHKHNKEIINNVLKIPVSLRIAFGLYKNLLNGITTVVNHGPKVDTGNDIITVFQECDVLHSVQFEKNWRIKLNISSHRKWPVVIHAGEGKDESSSNEIDKLIKWNFRKRDLIGVHGIAMTEKQVKSFKALIWCPDSNFFLIGKTAPVQKLKHLTSVLFGTDSAISSGWSIWEHLRLARSINVVSDEELYNMHTFSAAHTWKMKGSGKLEKGYDADIVVARKKNGLDGYNAYYALNPEDIILVIHKGKIRLFDAELQEHLKGSPDLTDNFSKVDVNGCLKYIYGDLVGLKDKIRSHYPGIIFPF